MSPKKRCYRAGEWEPEIIGDGDGAKQKLISITTTFRIGSQIPSYRKQFARTSRLELRVHRASENCDPPPPPGTVVLVRRISLLLIEAPDRTTKKTVKLSASE